MVKSSPKKLDICHDAKKTLGKRKSYKRRSPGSPKESPKNVTVRAPKKASKQNIKKTVWMRWLWAYHCAAKDKNAKTLYSKSMKDASELYTTVTQKAKINAMSDSEMKTYAKEVNA